jgi:hypothetical protein
MIRRGTFVRYRDWYDGDLCVVRYDGGFVGKAKPEAVIPMRVAKALQSATI